MATIIVLFIIDRILAATCPLTSKVGAIIGMFEVIATIVFIVLSFFFSPQWWYGLVFAAIYLLTPMIIPRIDANNLGAAGKLYSVIGSHVTPIITIAMFLLLFGVL